MQGPAARPATQPTTLHAFISAHDPGETGRAAQAAYEGHDVFIGQDKRLVVRPYNPTAWSRALVGALRHSDWLHGKAQDHGLVPVADLERLARAADRSIHGGDKPDAGEERVRSLRQRLSQLADDARLTVSRGSYLHTACRLVKEEASQRIDADLARLRTKLENQGAAERAVADELLGPDNAAGKATIARRIGAEGRELDEAIRDLAIECSVAASARLVTPRMHNLHLLQSGGHSRKDATAIADAAQAAGLGRLTPADVDHLRDARAVFRQAAAVGATSRSQAGRSTSEQQAVAILRRMDAREIADPRKDALVKIALAQAPATRPSSSSRELRDPVAAGLARLVAVPGQGRSPALASLQAHAARPGEAVATG